jgi:hypothetical protein
MKSVLGPLAVMLMMAWTPAWAQTPSDPSSQEPERADPDARVDPLQPDFNLAALPTTLRMPRHKWAFRITHRFNRPLGQGDLGDLFSDFLGFDSSANIGLELRFGLFRGTQVGVHRTSDRTIELFAQHNFLNPRDGARFGLDALVALEGQSNLRDAHQGAFGLIASKGFGRRIALYAEPVLVTNSNPAGSVDDTTLLLGLGGRLRLLRSVYLLGEIAPRLVGYDNGVDQMSFAIELRPGGHLFQINVSNGWGTTLGQLTRGAFNNDQWYLGFNITRKFF